MIDGRPLLNAKSYRFKDNIVLAFRCPFHGFVGLNVPGSYVRCRCGKAIYASVVDLIFADPETIRSLQVEEE